VTDRPVTDQPVLPEAAEPGDVIALGRDYLHHHSGDVLALVAETGCAVHVLNLKAKRGMSTGVVIVRVEDSATWVRVVVENEAISCRPAALTIAEAAELTGVTTSAIRQRLLRGRRNGDGHD